MSKIRPSLDGATGLNPYNRSLSSKFILEKLLLDLETEGPQIPRSTLSYRRSTSVESPRQIGPFMQNKANLPDDQMNVTIYITKEYENKSNWTLGENKANTKPIQSQYKANTKPNKPNPPPPNRADLAGQR